MVDVTIKYQGNVLAEMNESGTKTIETGGLYCEDDIVIAYVAKESGAENVKRWDITVPEKTGSYSYVYLVTDDTWLKANKDNTNLCISIVPKFPIPYDAVLKNQGMWLMSNKSLMVTSDGTECTGMSAYVHTNGSVTARPRTHHIMSSSGVNIGDFYLTAAGALAAVATADYPVVPGDYTVIAWLL